MAVGIDLTELEALMAQLNGLEEHEKYTISNAIFLESFSEQNIKNNFPTFGGVINGNKIPVIDMDSGYNGFVYVDGCKLPTCEVSAEWSEFQWCIKEIGCEVVICIKDLLPKFQVFWNTYRKLNEGDIASAFVQFIVELFQQKHLRAEIRTSFFGVEGAEVDDVPQEEINGCDGWIAQMQAIASTNPDLSVEITENAEATIADQTITNGEDVYNYLKEMYTKASQQPWFDPSRMKFILNRSLAMTLTAYLNQLSDLNGIGCDCIDPEKVKNPRVFTYDNISFWGIPLEVYNFEDYMRAQPYYFDGTRFTQFKNIIILARQDALLLGYEDEDSLSQFRIGYDEREREIYMQGSSLFGPAVSVPYFILAV